MRRHLPAKWALWRAQPSLRARSLVSTSPTRPAPTPILHQRPVRPLASSSASCSSASPSSSYDSINPSEISHFSRLSSQWWDPSGEFGLLHRMNPPRIEYIRQKVALDPDDEPPWTFDRRNDIDREARLRGTGRWLERKSCLDVGCGGGLLSESLARLGGHVLGIDASESNIAIANLHASQDPMLPYGHQGSTTQPSQTSLQYRHTTAEALREAGETFDLVCAMEVVEHVEQPGEFMKCLGDLIKPGGHLILSTISRTPLSRLLTLTLAENVLRLVTPGTHTYSKFIKPSELRRFVFAEMGGYEEWESNRDASDVRKHEAGSTQGIVYDPITGSWRLWDGTEGSWGKELGEGCNYMFHVKKRK